MKKSIALLFSVLIVSPFLTSEAEVTKPLTIAHRGASYDAPEHTFASYDLAIKQQADVIEIDLQLTKDGEVVAFHDETLERTTDGAGLVRHKTLAELKTLDAGSWFNKKYPERAKAAYSHEKIRTLDEILARYAGRAKLNIEMKVPEKNKGMEQQVALSLQRHGMLTAENFSNRTVVVESFTPASLKKLKTLAPGLPLNQSIWKGDVRKLAQPELTTIKTYADSVSINYQDATAENVRQLKQAGLIVRSYTIDNERDMERLSTYGISGVYTNRPNVHVMITSDG
ncbi:glycerophosphodiester phosphodiesterase [Macrococcus equipercicus]|nr:glycerophosphodiester phosphodiesterase [Macrococcus equipercicus]UTH14098.1 glycerophosphodiester phosphodiesterase [Macrococcus equipercicus]